MTPEAITQGSAMTEDERLSFESVLGHRFQSVKLLERALTHRSRREGVHGPGAQDNESLEFLGDRVLGLAVSQWLCASFPDWDSGQLSKALAQLVSTSSVSAAAIRLDIGNYLRLGKGEEKTGGREKRRLLADAYEAVLAAIYGDAGLAVAAQFVERSLIVPSMETKTETLHRADHKSVLQEWLQQQAMGLVEYVVSGERGPDHKKMFEIEARLNGRTLATSEGRSKKIAEQHAARLALAALRLEFADPKENA
jgi:ribonuclease-3